jgi:uncharacterized membrane protein
MNYLNKNRFIIFIVVIALSLFFGWFIFFLLSNTGRPLKTFNFSKPLFSLFKYLASGLGIYITYIFAESYAEIAKPHTLPSKIKCFLICIIVCAFIGFCSGDYLGTHREDVDPFFGGGDTVVDFEATPVQKVNEGLTVFLCILIPALFGVASGIKKVNQ